MSSDPIPLNAVAAPPAQGETKSDISDDTLTKARLDYVWDWWKFHAKQRTDMFNYFLIITGILANAYVQMVKNTPRQPDVEITLAILGILTSLGFLLLDFRNRGQLERANELLIAIENGTLFSKYPGKRLTGNLKTFSFIQHRFVFRTIEILVALGWLLSTLRASAT